MEVKKKWGMKIWSRFDTAVWKALIMTSDVDKLVSNYFEPFGNVSGDIVEFLLVHDDDLKSLRRLLQQELKTLIGRVQYSRKSQRVPDKAVTDSAELNLF